MRQSTMKDTHSNMTKGQPGWAGTRRNIQPL